VRDQVPLARKDSERHRDGVGDVVIEWTGTSHETSDCRLDLPFARRPKSSNRLLHRGRGQWDNANPCLSRCKAHNASDVTHDDGRAWVSSGGVDVLKGDDGRTLIAEQTVQVLIDTVQARGERVVRGGPDHACLKQGHGPTCALHIAITSLVKSWINTENEHRDPERKS
jgi:hypothetical protein